LVRFQFGARLQRIGDYAFSETVLTDILLPASVHVISNSCFYRCDRLTSITFEPGSRWKWSGGASFVRC
jgi:hypothetical protein